MKKIIITVVLALSITPAYADVYVKVDEQGNAIGGAIICEASVCGNPASSYAAATLGAGERYVLQGTGDSGIGASSNPNVKAQVDEDNTWTITTTTVVELPVPVTVDNTQIVSVNTQRVQQFNPLKPEMNIEPAPVLIDTSTVVTDTETAKIETATVSSNINFTTPDWFSEFMTWFNNFIKQFYAILEGLKK